MEKEPNFLRKYDTGELDCFDCIGRDNCKEYATAGTPEVNICRLCGKTYLSIHPPVCLLNEPYSPLEVDTLPDGISIPDFENEICPECKKMQEQGIVSPYWFECKSSENFNNDITSYCTGSASNEDELKELFSVIATRINENLDKEANRFPFRSGYNLSVGFTRYKASIFDIFINLYKNNNNLLNILNIIHNFFINMPEDISYATETDDTVIFAQYGKRMAYYEDFLQHLSQYKVMENRDI